MKLTTIYDTARQLYLAIDIVSTDYDSVNRIFGEILIEAEKVIPDFPTYNQKLLDRNNGHYHITVFSVAECGKFPQLMSLENLQLKNSNLLFKGIGSLVQKDTTETMTTWYIVVECPVLDMLRQNENLPTKDFHITIAFTHKDLFKGRKNDPNVMKL